MSRLNSGYPLHIQPTDLLQIEILHRSFTSDDENDVGDALSGIAGIKSG